MNIAGKRIVLTGGCSGIGAEVLLMLMTFDNTQILVVDKNTEQKPHIGERVRYLEMEISKPECLDEVFGQARFIMGGVDIFIANAGYSIYDFDLQSTDQEIASIFAVNTLSPIRAAYKMAKEEGEVMTVFIASAMSELALPGYALYSASKAALLKFADSYQYENHLDKHLMLILPIATKTSFFKSAKSSLGEQPKAPWPTMEAAEVARCIINGIEQNKKKVYPSKLNSIMRVFLSLHELLHKPYQWYYSKIR